MDFIDFELRAWRSDDAHVQALVHRSPVGDMRQPVTVPFDAASLEAFRRTFTDLPTGEQAVKWADLIAGGKQLAAVLLPPPVYSLLIRGLERISPDDGLRLRLCLDSALADLPWECLYRPDAAGQSPSEGFLALDSRISLVREAPRVSTTASRPRRKQHLLFAGAPFMVQGVDRWGVELERQNLEEALKPVNDLLSVESVTADKMSFETALAHEGIDIFHYSGHADTTIDDRGFLVEEIRTERTDDPRFVMWQSQDYKRLYNTDKLYIDPLYVERLSNLLRRAGTRLAVFSACNSGRWSFVEPLLRAGLPVVIGAQGMLHSMSAVAFFHKLYKALAIGLSLDEAVTWARMSLLEPDTITDDLRWQWAMFTVYMPTPDALLFPKPRLPKIQGRQESLRSQRQQTVINIAKLVYQDIDQQIGKVEGSGRVVGSSIDQIKDQ
jgi:hypothetical protein